MTRRAVAIQIYRKIDLMQISRDRKLRIASLFVLYALHSYLKLDFDPISAFFGDEK